jgi:hypothetical protein
MGKQMSKAPTWREYLMPDELAVAREAEASIATLRNRAVQRMRLAYAAKNSKRTRRKYAELPRPEGMS